MPFSLALLMAFTAALLAVAVCGVLWRRGDVRAPDAASPAPGRTARDAEAQEAAAADGIPPYAPPAGSLLAGQLEIGQAFHVQTRTARYVLTLRDPMIGQYDAVRIGPKRGTEIVEERFQMIFAGTFVPGYGLRFGEFVLGGNLSYRKVRAGEVLPVRPSSTVERVFFCIPESHQRQAS